MANEIPPNLPIPPIPPAGVEPGRGFDAPDPFEEGVDSMPSKTSQPNPLITPPQVDESLTSEEPVFKQPNVSDRKGTKWLFISIIILVILLLLGALIAIAMRFFNTSSNPAVSSQPSPSPSAAVESSTPLVTSSQPVGSNADDPDQDGLNNAEERLYGTDPNNPDTDGDGYPDGEEVKNGYNPLGSGTLDSDNDGLPDPVERKMGTDPFNPDTDGDGYSDGSEVAHGHNPLIPAPNDKL